MDIWVDSRDLQRAKWTQEVRRCCARNGRHHKAASGVELPTRKERATRRRAIGDQLSRCRVAHKDEASKESRQRCARPFTEPSKKEPMRRCLGLPEPAHVRVHVSRASRASRHSHMALCRTFAAVVEHGPVLLR